MHDQLKVPHGEVALPGESAGAQPVLEPVEQWRGMQEAAGRLGLQPVGDLTKLGRGKHTTRHVSLLEVRPHAYDPWMYRCINTSWCYQLSLSQWHSKSMSVFGIHCFASEV